MRIMRTCLVVIATTALLGGCAWIEQSSVSSGSRPARGSAASGDPSVSQSGRFVAFSSAADNLVPSDTNGVADVFVHDHVSEVTERISVSTEEGQGDGASREPSISDDGRFVAFTTSANNLSPILFAQPQFYVRDRQLGITMPIDAGDYRDGKESGYSLPAMSGNGRFVAFIANRTYPASTTTRVGPFVRDLVTGTTKLMPSIAGVDASFFFPDVGPSISDDGQRIVYSTLDLRGSPTEGYPFRTLVADTTTASIIETVYSVVLPGSPTTIPRIEPTISGDGTEVALAKTEAGVTTISRFDLEIPSILPVFTGIPEARDLALSDDGSVLGFRRSSQYVVSTNGGTPRVVSADRLGRAVSASSGDLSGDGRWVAFSSADLRLGRNDTNGVDDIFLRSTRPSLFARPS